MPCNMQARINQKACLDLCIKFSLALLDARARVVFMRSQKKYLQTNSRTQFSLLNIAFRHRTPTFSWFACSSTRQAARMHTYSNLNEMRILPSTKSASRKYCTFRQHARVTRKISRRHVQQQGIQRMRGDMRPALNVLFRSRVF
jgi:hypothetical protein